MRWLRMISSARSSPASSLIVTTGVRMVLVFRIDPGPGNYVTKGVRSSALVNRDPYGKGWMIKLKLKDPKELEGLLRADVYAKHIGE